MSIYIYIYVVYYLERGFQYTGRYKKLDSASIYIYCHNMHTAFSSVPFSLLQSIVSDNITIDSIPMCCLVPPNLISHIYRGGTGFWFGRGGGGGGGGNTHVRFIVYLISSASIILIMYVCVCVCNITMLYMILRYLAPRLWSD